MAYQHIIFSINYTKFAKEVARLLNRSKPYDSLVKPKNSDEDTIAFSELVFQEDVFGKDFENELWKTANTGFESVTRSMRKQTNGNTPMGIWRSFNTEVITWQTKLLADGHYLSTGLIKDCFRLIMFLYAEAAVREGSDTVSKSDLFKEAVAWVRLRDAMVDASRNRAFQKQAFDQLDDFSDEDVQNLLNLKARSRVEHAIRPSNIEPYLLAASLRDLCISFPRSPSGRVCSSVHLVPLSGGPLVLELVRATGELAPMGCILMSARMFFMHAGAEADLAYKFLWLFVIQSSYYIALIDEFTEIVPWVTREELLETEAEDELPTVGELTEVAPEAAETGEPAVPEWRPYEPPLPAVSEPETESVAAKPTSKNRDLLRRAVSLERVLTVLKSDYGVTVEWSDHPMLCRDGKRFRYLNPHERATKWNAQIVRQALKVFGIDRVEFYGKL